MNICPGVPLYDCTSDAIPELRKVVLPDNAVIAAYGTGSPGIRWTTQDERQFPDRPIVTIDQGYTGSPVLYAVVRDVERGAWTLDRALSVPWRAPHKVIYLGHQDLPELAARNWDGGVWVACSGWPVTKRLTYPGLDIVAVQYDFTRAWDKSVIYDPRWVYSFSVTPHPIATSFGWGFVPQATWQLLVHGKDTTVNQQVAHNHVQLELEPGEYTAQVRISNSPLWSETRTFKVEGK